MRFASDRLGSLKSRDVSQAPLAIPGALAVP
jgi:hypothetical protein